MPTTVPGMHIHTKLAYKKRAYRKDLFVLQTWNRIYIHSDVMCSATWKLLLCLEIEIIISGSWPFFFQYILLKRKWHSKTDKKKMLRDKALPKTGPEGPEDSAGSLTHWILTQAQHHGLAEGCLQSALGYLSGDAEFSKKWKDKPISCLFNKAIR